MTRGRKRSIWIALGPAILLPGCAIEPPRSLRVPAVEYADRVQGRTDERMVNDRMPTPQQARFESDVRRAQGGAADQRAQVRFVDGMIDPNDGHRALPRDRDVVTNLDSPPGDAPEYGSRTALVRDYRGPLNLGDPGVSSSLWKESRGGTDLLRDYRAWRPMDLITIVVSENTSGKKQADTDIKQDSSLQASITNFLGLENWSGLGTSKTGSSTPGLDLSNLATASTTSKFKGEGETQRSGNLKGKISAVVAEVLPSGLLRIEGEKIISLNSEEEEMVISGLVRPEDINSANEVDSSKIANVRIDYYGSGTVGDAQHGGWLGRLVRHFWPF